MPSPIQFLSGFKLTTGTLISPHWKITSATSTCDEVEQGNYSFDVNLSLRSLTMSSSPSSAVASLRKSSSQPVVVYTPHGVPFDCSLHGVRLALSSIP